MAPSRPSSPRRILRQRSGLAARAQLEGGGAVTHANRGKGWEAKLDTQHTLYRKKGRAVIFHAH